MHCCSAMGKDYMFVVMIYSGIQVNSCHANNSNRQNLVTSEFGIHSDAAEHNTTSLLYILQIRNPNYSVHSSKGEKNALRKKQDSCSSVDVKEQSFISHSQLTF